MEGLTTCLDPGRGWTSTSGGWNFLKRQECWEGHEQALITTIRKETKRTEELEEAGYRSPPWAVLRALQQINSATKMAVSEDHALCWVHKDLTVTTKQIQALLTAARASGGKFECQVRLTGIEREYWMGTEIGRLGGYGFRGTVTAGDGSNENGGKMGAGYVNLRK